MTALVDITEFVVPRQLIGQTLESLGRAGAQGYEAFVLWGGRADETGRRFDFITGYFPEQTTSASDGGLLVVVSGEALFRVNRSFYEHGLTLAAQVHSHPTDAFHSATDDAYPLMTLIGGLSGVVPDFGRGGLRDFDRWAWYRLEGPELWEPIDGRTTITVAESKL